MSSELMDTEVGGEQTQYESIKTVTNPHSKVSGQLGGQSENTSAPSATSSDNVSKARGEQTAENMRYGQAISEQGVGGFTAPEYNSGSAKQEGGFGGDEKVEDEGVGRMRREQGYGGDREMRKDVGA